VTGKPVVVSCAVVLGVGALGGVVAWKLAFFVDYGDWSGRVAVLLGVVLRALGGVWSACGVSWGLVCLWAGGDECGRWEAV
jgi:hypothetical protein